MTQTKFTKGPWQVWGDWAIKDCTPAENLIATFEHHDQDPEAAFANAHLIAAAPDMYKLLQRFLPMDEDGNGWDFQYNDGSEEMGQDVINLLAKAKGE